MTVEKAIRELSVEYLGDTEEIKEAKKMAIKALSAPEREKGEWVRFQSNEFQPWHIRCSECGQYWSIDDHAKIFKYCFNCGANMRGGKE